MDDSAWAALVGFIGVVGLIVVILALAWVVTIIDRHRQTRTGDR